MISALPCDSSVCVFHAALGFVIVGGWLVLFLFGAGGMVVRREPGRWFWRLLGFLQAVLILQLLAGTVLLIAGHRPDTWRHYVYGIIGPVVVLVVAHVLGRGTANEEDTWKTFTWAAFFVFGLTLMALFTGLQYL